MPELELLSPASQAKDSMKVIGLSHQSMIEKYTPSFQSPTVDVAYFLVDFIEE